MSNGIDDFDAAGVVPAGAPWPVSPDQGMSIDAQWSPPIYGADIKKASSYPGTEPPAPLEYHVDLTGIVADFNSHPVRAGNDLGRNVPAEGKSFAEPTNSYVGSSDNY